jgi:phosphoribosylformimino-5-aminoimidazole carboxamide ribonucleotide (ProFAR) isomerase
MVQTPNKPATKLPPSKHQFAEVIHRLEAGGAMIPDTPENLMQIIAIWKAYAVPMDFTGGICFTSPNGYFYTRFLSLNTSCPRSI